MIGIVTSKLYMPFLFATVIYGVVCINEILIQLFFILCCSAVCLATWSRSSSGILFVETGRCFGTFYSAWLQVYWECM